MTEEQSPSEFRVSKNADLYVPQYKKDGAWIDIEFDGSHWDDYSCRFSYTNAVQRLYIHFYKIKPDKDWGFSISKIFENRDFFYFNFTSF